MTNEEIKKIGKEVDAVGIAIIIIIVMLFFLQMLALDYTERRLTKQIEKLQSKDQHKP